MLKVLYAFLILLIVSGNGFSQKFEAESAILSGGAVKQTVSAASGGYIVAQQEGMLTFNLNFADQGYYNVYIKVASPNGDKYNLFAVDGTSIGFSTTNGSVYQYLKVISSLKLSAGDHKIEILKSWGWINIDYIEFEKTDPSTRFNTNKTLVTPDPTDEAVRLYQFLYDNYGKKIISGVSTVEEADWLKTNTGKSPALVGLDYLFCGRGYSWYDDNQPFNQGKAWYEKNGIVNFHWHWRDPSRVTEEFYTAQTAFDISKIFDENSAEYAAMISDIDYISGQLKRFQDAKIPVIWRPLHEAAGGWFWWGAKGAAPCKKLWQVMFDRMVNVNGLHNLIWVWTREPDDDAWYPGDEYVDIVGRDIYRDGDHSSQVLEFNDMVDRYNGEKIITISESGSFPDVDNLVKDAAGWSWYMPWNGKYTWDAAYNPLALWQKAFASDYVLTLDEMPVLANYPDSGKVVYSPTVGAIRWDGWVGDNGSWQIGPIVERTLGPEKFHYRAPFFSIVTAKDSIKIDGTTQEIMDREIAYAKSAGLDYWAYCWYPDGCGLEAARKLHQTSTHANDVNWCVVLGAFEENVSNSYGATLVSDFARENYQKVLGGRPLIYLYGSDLTKAGLDKLRKMTTDKLLKTPYVVVMDWGASSAADYCTKIGADAISSYAALGSNNLPYADIIPPQSIANWNSFALKKPVVPWIGTGWNARPRMESPNPWSAYYSDASNCQDATAQDIKDFLQTGIEWTMANKSKAVANTIIMYAWNEHDEGYGAICPTLGADGNPNTERLDSVRQVLMGRNIDTTNIITYQLDVFLKDSRTNLPLPGIAVKVYSQFAVSDSEGIAHFNGVPDFFVLNIEDENYIPVKNHVFSISSDTSLNYNLVWKGYNVVFTLMDSKTLEKFWGVPITFGTQTEVSDIDGRAIFFVDTGFYDYIINKISYKIETGSLIVVNDTSLNFYLEQLSAYAKFRLKDGITPVDNAVVKINSDSLVSNAIGIAQFKELPLDILYPYSITKEGYLPFAGEFYLSHDTVIDVSLEKNTLGTGKPGNLDNFKVWPNPATDFLHCSFPPECISSTFIITDMLGNKLYTTSVKETELTLSLQNFQPGAYILRVISDFEYSRVLIVSK
jgi:mannan endo-1,4-beta-mannosidase